MERGSDSRPPSPAEGRMLRPRSSKRRPAFPVEFCGLVLSCQMGRFMRKDGVMGLILHIAMELGRNYLVLD